MSVQKRALASCLGLLALFAAMPVGAVSDVICSPFVHYTRLVGDMANDNTCSDDDIQSAIDHIICPNTTIYVVQTPTHMYTAEHLLIQDMSFTIVGSSASTCADAVGNQGAALDGADAVTSGPAVTISGAGHSGDSVVSIHGDSNITLQSLVITGGRSDKDQFGGGIYFGGKGSLTLNTTNVTDNFAGYGGGINVIAEGGDVAVTLNHSEVLSNTAQYNGGGIRMEGFSRLYMLDASSTIAFNKVIGPDSTDPNGGYGGGLVLYGPARADIASGAPNGAVSFNSAVFGGGIAAVATTSGAAVARLFTVDPHLPVTIAENTASQGGGGVFTEGIFDGDFQPSGTLCATNSHFFGNVAPEGAAFYATSDTQGRPGGSLYLNPGGDCGPESIASLGAVDCAAGEPCNLFDDNIAQDNAQVLSGSIIYGQSYGEIQATRFTMRDNEGAQMIKLENGTGVVEDHIKYCLVVDNHSVHEPVHLEHESVLQIANCTVANNAIEDGYAFYALDGYDLLDIVVWQPGRETLDHNDADCAPDCTLAQNVVASDITTFPAQTSTGLKQADPLFADAGNANVDARDYRLTAYVQNGKVTASPAIDAAPAGANDGNDLDGNATDLDVPLVPDRNPGWFHDLGAYEAQPIADRIFADAFGDPITLVR